MAFLSTLDSTAGTNVLAFTLGTTIALALPFRSTKPKATDLFSEPLPRLPCFFPPHPIHLLRKVPTIAISGPLPRWVEGTNLNITDYGFLLRLSANIKLFA